jgi:hypothetical protein
MYCEGSKPFQIPMTPFVFIFAVCGRAVNTSVYDARKYVDPSSERCAIKTENCTFTNSRGGTRYRLAFGSTCVLSLTGCRIGQCYALLDWSYQRRWSYVPGVRKSAFSSFDVTNVDVLNVSSAGVYFKPSGSTITLQFTVQTCDNFYRLHPFTETEDCTADGPEISAPIRGPFICGENGIHNPAML